MGSQDPPEAKSLDVDKLQDKLAILPLSEDEDNSQQIEEDKDADTKDGVSTAELFGLEGEDIILINNGLIIIIKQGLPHLVHLMIFQVSH